MSRKPGLLVLSLLLILGLGWLISRIEWVELENDSKPTREAIRDPYLAASLFLQNQGLTVHSEVGLHHLRESNFLSGDEDTLLLLDAYGALTEMQAAHLVRWVRHGGQLIMSGQNPYQSQESLDEDYLFDLFGVQVKRRTSQDRGEILKSILGMGATCGEYQDPAEVRFEPDGPQVQVVFPEANRLILQDEEEAMILRDQLGPRLAQFELGAGRVILLADGQLWSNPYIACRDNAYVLWKLVADSPAVWILRNQDAPSLWQLLWQHAGWCLSLMMLLLALFLWRQGLRFGPLAKETSVHRRRFMEHIQASAHFLWRRGQAQTLVETLRAEIEAKLAQRLPGYASWPQSRQFEEISRLTGLPQVMIEQAMGATPKGEFLFTQSVHDLQTIRNKL